MRTLIEYQTEDFPDSYIENEQKKLNELYDAFSKKYGLINSRANNSAFNSDSSYCLLSSLEILDDEGNFIRKADMFSKRTIKQKVTVTSVDTASEALALSLAEKTKIDIEYMCSLTGKSEEEIAEDLKGVIFLNPRYSERSRELKYLPADEYLSGNIREKLNEAKMAAEDDSSFEINVKALIEVMPKDLSAGEISVRLGATWIPPEDIERFMFELFGTLPILRLGKKKACLCRGAKRQSPCLNREMSLPVRTERQASRSMSKGCLMFRKPTAVVIIHEENRTNAEC